MSLPLQGLSVSSIHHRWSWTPKLDPERLEFQGFRYNNETIFKCWWPQSCRNMSLRHDLHSTVLLSQMSSPTDTFVFMIVHLTRVPSENRLNCLDKLLLVKINFGEWFWLTGSGVIFSLLTSIVPHTETGLHPTDLCAELNVLTEESKKGPNRVKESTVHYLFLRTISSLNINKRLPVLPDC